jgi:uncharacterized protein YyaL (SSP411 family)
MTESIRWLDWAEPALAQASAANAPILLSLVTAWSEECRMMERSTFSHPAVIAAVSSQFVTIRVDADRRPDINERYNLGGWPTTAFLTGDGKTLSGGTYLDVDEMIMLSRQVADAWRERGPELRARAAETPPCTENSAAAAQPDSTAADHLRSMIVEQFDSVHGGFGTAPKLPHVSALLLALSLAAEDGGAADAELASIAETTLDKMSSLWDSAGGGFYRYADAADWSRPGPEKTLEDNAALLHLYIEASLRRASDDCRARAGALVRWVKAGLANENDGGFYNARSGTLVDRSMYVDRNAQMVAAFLRAAGLFDDPWLRNFALKSFEAVVLPAYSPGGGVAHIVDGATVRGLLSDQVHASGAAIWAHAATEQLPYSMLAAELMQFAVRTMWDDSAGAFRDRTSASDPVRPFQLNCEAACVLDRLATLTGDGAHRERAITILRTLAPEYRRHNLFGAAYALAVREVIDRRLPAGLALTKVEWALEPPATGEVAT